MMTRVNPIAVPDNKENKNTSIKRPMNAFMVFRKEQSIVVRQSQGLRKNQEVSAEVARIWKAMSQEEQAPYYEKAAQLKEEHKKMYPEYKYQPKRKDMKNVTVKKEEPVAPGNYYHDYTQYSSLNGGYPIQQYVREEVNDQGEWVYDEESRQWVRRAVYHTDEHQMQYQDYQFQPQVDHTNMVNLYDESENVCYVPHHELYSDHVQYGTGLEQPVIEEKPVEIVDDFADITPTLRVAADFPWDEALKDLAFDIPNF